MSNGSWYFLGFKLWKTTRAHPTAATKKKISSNSKLVWNSKEQGTYWKDKNKQSVVEHWQHKEK